MMKRIIDLVSWVAMALVLVAVALRFQTLKPEWVDYGTPVAISALVLLLVWFVSLGFSGKRAARYGTLTAVSVLVVLGILVAINYIGARQNKRWDLTANQQFSLSDQTRNVLRKLDSPLQIMVFDKEDGFQRFKDKLREYQVQLEAGLDRIRRSRQEADPRLAEPGPAVRDDPLQVQGPQRAHHDRHRAGHHDRDHQGRSGPAEKGLLHAGPRRKGCVLGGARRLQGESPTRLTRENYTVDKIVLAQAGSVPDDAAVVVVAGPKTDFLPGEIEALKKYLGKSGKLLLAIDPPDKLDSPPLSNLIALAHDWGIDVGNDIVVDVSGMGQLIGTDQSVPVAAPPTRRTRSRSGSSC